MATKSLISRILPFLTVMVLCITSPYVQAHGNRGTQVDNTCSKVNGTKPYAVNAAGTRCTLCHEDAHAVRHDPEWAWVQQGQDSDGQKHFCYVQGFISAPQTDMAVSPGGKVNFKARGFSPTSGVGAVSFNWHFDDGRPDLTGSALNGVAMPSPGKVVVTLTTTGGPSDQTDPANPMDDQDFSRYYHRTIDVTTTVTMANLESYTVKSGETLYVPAPGVLANDTGTGTLTAILVQNARKGALTLNPNGGFSYTPIAGLSGEDSFAYKASNGVFTSDPVTVTITIAAARPVANADRYFVQPGKVLTIPAPGILANDTGTNPVSVKLVKNVARGKLTLKSNGSFVYRPVAGYRGTDRFTYTANNSAGTSVSARVSIDVGACTDQDADGYSAEGGHCGPIDCDDSKPNVNPGKREICTNNIDDDCNDLIDLDDPLCTGKDCIGKLASSQLRIDSATWNKKSQQLIVKGSRALPGASVTVSNAATGKKVGQAKVASNGVWTFSIKLSLAGVPCQVRAETPNASGQSAVTGPDKCNPSVPTCGK